ncbi:MAG: zinc-ribbon domain-containing protein [Candidatus Omnitrophica bacterium]|nr:zinc-ribbon domain-containing protein [Candidatus Omnitrophota bacterium]MDD5487949.1 zinc-ribbon domain-containing protein [Candidatus Omnitrophota bacterium]
MSNPVYCQNCGKPIYDEDALLCLYCGEEIGRPVGVLGKMRYSAHGLVFAVVILLVVILFLLWVL